MNRKATADTIPDFYLLERQNEVAILRLGKNFLFEGIRSGRYLHCNGRSEIERHYQVLYKRILPNYNQMEVLEMPRGDGTGPRGQGAGTGRGMRNQQGGGRGRGGGIGAGPGGDCVCPNCGEKVSHQLGTPCFQQKCPKCGAAMIRG